MLVGGHRVRLTVDGQAGDLAAVGRIDAQVERDRALGGVLAGAEDPGRQRGEVAGHRGGQREGRTQVLGAVAPAVDRGRRPAVLQVVVHLPRGAVVDVHAHLRRTAAAADRPTDGAAVEDRLLVVVRGPQLDPVLPGRGGQPTDGQLLVPLAGHHRVEDLAGHLLEEGVLLLGVGDRLVGLVEEDRDDVAGVERDAAGDRDRTRAAHHRGQRDRVDRHDAVQPDPLLALDHRLRDLRSLGEVRCEVQVTRVRGGRAAVLLLGVAWQLDHRLGERTEVTRRSLPAHRHLAVLGVQDRERARQAAGRAQLGGVLDDQQVVARLLLAEHVGEQLEGVSAGRGRRLSAIELVLQVADEVVEREQQVVGAHTGELGVGPVDRVRRTAYVGSQALHLREVETLVGRPEPALAHRLAELERDRGVLPRGRVQDLGDGLDGADVLPDERHVPAEVPQHAIGGAPGLRRPVPEVGEGPGGAVEVAGADPLLDQLAAVACVQQCPRGRHGLPGEDAQADQHQDDQAPHDPPSRQAGGGQARHGRRLGDRDAARPARPGSRRPPRGAGPP